MQQRESSSNSSLLLKWWKNINPNKPELGQSSQSNFDLRDTDNLPTTLRERQQSAATTKLSAPQPSFRERTTRPAVRVINRLETAPYEGWQKIKKLALRDRGGQPRDPHRGGLPKSDTLIAQAQANLLPAMILALSLQRDEHDNPRVPVLLSQIAVSVSYDDPHDGTPPVQRPKIRRGMTAIRKRRRPTTYKITVAYGPNLKWVVHRRYWDFVKLHYRYRSHDIVRTRIPHFPNLPIRHAGQKKVGQGDDQSLDDRPPSHMDSVLDSDIHLPQLDKPASNSNILVEPNTEYLPVLQEYLQLLIQKVVPTGYINRLCKFLEISTIGIQLAATNPDGYHGKEGYLTIVTRSDHAPKHSRQFADTIAEGCLCRVVATHLGSSHRPKWFVVRESYIVCVEGPHEDTLFDVFLADGGFEVTRMSFSDQALRQWRSDIRKGKQVGTKLISNRHWTGARSTLCLKNLHGLWYLRAKNETLAKQFEDSIKRMMSSVWCQQHRFDSFAPIRKNIQATWFVDGRDYLWDVSVALDNAKECIYIHDWWLNFHRPLFYYSWLYFSLVFFCSLQSPELYLRRPAAHNLQWRLDKLLKRKADQGVKIYIVMYKEVAMALPLYSHYAKKHLLSLSDNIHVQRHPSRALDIFNKSNIFFWAHHEKICVIDYDIAYIGGIDLCFGRWDTATHAVVDEGDPTLNPNNRHPQMWPGKDYSNPRILDFHTLDRPFEDNMDRSKLPRMPWHDVSMRLCGQSARDVARHFVQRWNFLRRRKPSAPKRPTPLLVPKPDLPSSFTIDPNDRRLCHPHTSRQCDVQVLRSVSEWSIGNLNHVEQSIHSAYVDTIENSEHFVYIGKATGMTVIENKIGDALVKRILRAKAENKRWRAIIVIPLIPGFEANVEETEATTVRLIMHCQFLSICRGPDSLLGRLRAAGIERTHDYINFFGLRNWGELNNEFVTEQVYIHAKVMIVDDRTVIMGSANINERSQLGTRDSEIAACVQDQEMIDSTVDGKPAQVSKFAHTLRLRLMCEHVGIDVDTLEDDPSTSPAFTKHVDKSRVKPIPPIVQPLSEKEEPSDKYMVDDPADCTIGAAAQPNSPTLETNAVTREETGDSTSSPEEEKSESEHRHSSASMFGSKKRKNLKEQHAAFWTTLDCDTDNNGDGVDPESSYSRVPVDSLAMQYTASEIRNLLVDPLSDACQDFWYATARRNTHLFRQSFLVVPDNNVRSWDQHREFLKMAKIYLGRKDAKDGTKATAAAAVVTTEPVIMYETGETVRDLLKQIQGHLVIWPNQFLEEEDKKNEFVFGHDKLMPLEIFD
ncbi:uncharacterized protein BYT42DRAFT_498917 [Radiomyces spectabilis]|uniref:uncharacterized protein n=1 Tax=Radiomyces spectabilis TaxID=64574 RepID=UPI00221FEDA0|nr:uncharacterized protein BYT42DRAFT_498917 [Radiomyces spectabilis]KAI8376326.1 hypothetical protein BYT42DRAFT_498917 [Radiomyces spectabilis]